MADHPRGLARPGEGAAPSPLDLGPDRVNELSDIYTSAVNAFWRFAATGRHGDKDRAHQAGLRAIADAVAPPAAPGAAVRWRPMSEEPLDRPVTARKLLPDGSWWYARVKAWRVDEDEAGRFGTHGYELIHYNGDVTMGRFYGPFDAWCEVGDDLAPAPASALPGAEAVADVTPAMWSAGRRAVDGPCEMIRTASSYEVASAHADRLPDAVWTAMERACLARPDAPAGPGLAGAVRDAAQAVVDEYDATPVAFSGEGFDKAIATLRVALGSDVTCPVCEGTGESDRAEEPCQYCSGSGLIKADPNDAALDGGAGGGWRPIETAPKDGTRILMDFGGRVGIHAVSWTNGASDIAIWCVDDMKHGPYAVRGYMDAVAWMPLPAPPRSGQRGGDDAQG